MKITKSDLITTYAQSIGIDAAKELIAKKINAAALADKESYTEEEIARICSELAKDGGLIRIVTHAFFVHVQRKKSEEQTLLLDNIETQIWYLTDRETYGAVNKAHAEFWGLEKTEFEDRSLYDVIGREDAEVYIAGNREVFEKRKQIHTEQWIKNGKGESRLLSITRTPKLGDNGGVEYVICTAEDITERKHAEDALLESESKISSILSSLVDLVFVFDEEGRFIFHQYPSEEQLYVPPEEFMGKKHADVMPPRLNKMFANALVKNKKGEVAEYNYWLEIHGKIEWYSVKLSPMFLDGKFAASVAVVRNITEQKQAEYQIKKSLKEKEVLLREIHHRVKNNLQVVSSMLNMQARITNDKNIAYILSEARNRINAMALIHSQLYESRSLSEVNMKRFIERLLTHLFQCYPIQDTKVTPVVHVVDYPLPLSIAVPVGLITNELLANAFKHAFVNREEGTIAVILGVSEKGVVRLRVSDDGVGLPDGFNLNTINTLGLRMVKIMVEDQLQGSIVITRNEGTTFKIAFEMANGERE